MVLLRRVVGAIGRYRIVGSESFWHDLGGIGPAGVGNGWGFWEFGDHGCRSMMARPSKTVLLSQRQPQTADPLPVFQAVAGPQYAGMLGMGRLVGSGNAVTPKGRAQDLSRFQHHLDHMLIAMQFGGQRRVAVQEEDIHQTLPFSGKVFRPPAG